MNFFATNYFELESRLFNIEEELCSEEFVLEGPFKTSLHVYTVGIEKLTFGVMQERLGVDGAETAWQYRIQTHGATTHCKRKQLPPRYPATPHT